jgi:two-component system response regulator DevR
MKKINVFLVEADLNWLRWLREFIEKQEDMTVIGTATAKEGVVQQITAMNIDVVLLDFMLTADGWEGLEIAIEMNKVNNVPIIMLSSLTDKDAILDTYAAGAVNYINKTNIKDIPDAIRVAYMHQTFDHSTTIDTVCSELKRMLNKERDNLLTPAEKGILVHIHQGESRSQIATKEFITDSTLKNHINKILKKLGVKTSKEAVETARRRGIL